jgi:hypothetical protein
MVDMSGFSASEGVVVFAMTAPQSEPFLSGRLGSSLFFFMRRPTLSSVYPRLPKMVLVISFS